MKPISSSNLHPVAKRMLHCALGAAIEIPHIAMWGEEENAPSKVGLGMDAVARLMSWHLMTIIFVSRFITAVFVDSCSCLYAKVGHNLLLATCVSGFT
jgi:hypothetical protein